MLHTLFQAYAASPLSHAIRGSSWAFAIIEMAHLMMLALFGGVLLIGGLGLTGTAFQFPDRTGAWLSLRRTGLWALAGLVLSGLLMIGSNPMKYYFHTAFRAKMVLLAFAVIASAIVERGIRPGAVRPILTNFAVATALLLWFAVAVAGRMIGFF